MQIGDLITTYHKGYFRLVRIERRFVTEESKKWSCYGHMEVGEEISPLYYYVQEYDSNGTPKKSREKCCDAGFCQLAETSIREELEKAKKRISVLEKIDTKSLAQ